METRSERMKALWADPVVRDRMEEGLRRARERDGGAHTMANLAVARSPEGVAKKLAAFRDPEYRARKAATEKALWMDPLIRAKYEASTAAPERRAKVSRGARETWTDERIAAARRTMNGAAVEVDGVRTVYRSVKAAFAALGLPIGAHKDFRVKLKARRRAAFVWEGVAYSFVLID